MKDIFGVDLNEYKQQVATFFNRRTNYDKEGNFHPRLAGGQKILDIATGTGLVAIPATHIVGSEGKVVGVDISSGMLSQAQRKIEAEGLQNIELIEADAEYLTSSPSVHHGGFQILLSGFPLSTTRLT